MTMSPASASQFASSESSAQAPRPRRRIALSVGFTLAAALSLSGCNSPFSKSTDDGSTDTVTSAAAVTSSSLNAPVGSTTRSTKVVAAAANARVESAPAANVPDVPTTSNCSLPAPGYARCMSVAQTEPAGPVSVTPNTSAAPATLPGGYGPSDLASAYKLDNTRGAGQTVAIVDAYDNPSAESGLAAYRSMYSLPACTTSNGCFRKVNQSGTSSPMPAANSGWAGEIALDVDMVSAVCPQCHILLVEANSASMADLGISVNTAVSLGAKFVSNSYGGGDFSGESYYDQYFNHPGVVITASTGDSGYGVSYPASSPYVTAVGGTTLTQNSGVVRGWGESAWSGAGSGCTPNEPRPSVQATVGTGCSTRAVADVSAVANPSTGVAVYNGGWAVYGGTSASSPIVASVYALSGTPGSTDNPNTYPYATSSGLFDVTAGANGSCSTTQLCSARTGWDGPTGLGTPNGLSAFSSTGSGGPTPVPTPTPGPGTPTPGPGTPTPAPTFGGTISITGAPIAGIATAISVTPTLPSGDSLASLSWAVGRKDCLLGSAASASTTVTCSGTSATATSVSVTLHDTLGATKIISRALTFSTTAGRAISISLNATGQTGSPQNFCASVGMPIRAVVTDTATGSPIYGLKVGLTRQYGTSKPTSLGVLVSALDGSATFTGGLAVAANFTAATGAQAVFSAGSTVLAGLPVTCTSSLTASADKSTSYYGDAVTITGTLNLNEPGRGNVPFAGMGLTVVGTYSTGTVNLGTAKTNADGNYSVIVHPTSTGPISVQLAAGPGWTAATAVAGTTTVSMPSTVLTATLSASDVGYTAPTRVSGTLLRDAGGTRTGIKGAKVQVTATTNVGGVQTSKIVGAPIVAADGSWALMIAPASDQTISVSFAGGPGLSAAFAAAGSITTHTWTTAVSVSAATISGPRTQISGAVTRNYGGATIGAPGLPVRIYRQVSGGAPVLIAGVSTNTAGGYSAIIPLVGTGDIWASVSSVSGYTDTTSAHAAYVAPTPVGAAAASVRGAAMSFSVRVAVPRGVSFQLQQAISGSWVTIGTGSTSSLGTGTVTASIYNYAGTQYFRIVTSADGLGVPGASNTVVVR